MKSHNRQINTYMDLSRDLKFHEKRMLEINHEVMGDFSGELLDIGCASCVFLSSLHAAFPKARLQGLELSKKLVKIARNRLADTGVEVVIGDAISYKPTKKYDAITASGILSVFDDPIAVLDVWLDWLKPDGTLFVFGRFNSRDVDTRINYRSHYNDLGWETGFTSYAVSTVQKHLEAKGYSASFEPFEVPIDIAETEDPIRGYTRPLADGSKILLNGANLVAEQYFLTIKSLPSEK